MLTYVENYGEDLDGNRGSWARIWELEDSDTPEILEKIAEAKEELGYIPEELDVWFVCEVTDEDVVFTINPFEYI